MLTWSRIDAGIFVKNGYASERYAARFWLGSTGELLAEVPNNSAATTYELWRSGDQGAHWTQIALGKSGRIIDFVVPENQGPRFWRACAIYEAFGDYTHPPVQQISCTLDGGATWLDTGGENNYHMDVFAQASDGAVLAVTPSPFHGEVARTLVRVAPGQSAWESLGALPLSGAPQYIAGGGTAVLWFAGSYSATYP
jgi:hypothetical protein